jgi:hypothetical protein
VVTESRQQLGSLRLLIRVNASLASAYAASGDTTRAIELLEEARTALQGSATQPSAATIECSLAQLWLCVAAAELHLGRRRSAEASLDQARELGWLDLQWLRTDLELRPLAGSVAFERFVKELESAPECSVRLPDFTVAQASGD